MSPRDRGRSGRRIPTRVVAALAAAGLAITLSAAPAGAAGMASVGGSISCSGLQFVGTSATVKGTVRFQLNNRVAGGNPLYADLGYSSAWAPWGWKWWVSSSREFYAYGLGSTGNAKNPSRYCQYMAS